MNKIPAHKVNKNNTNIRMYSDSLWRELRKCRWKKIDHSLLDKFIPFNGETIEQYRLNNEFKALYGTQRYDPFEEFVTRFHCSINEDTNFRCDIDFISKRYFNEKQAAVAKAWLFGGLTQQETARMLNISQATVSNLLREVKAVLKQQYYSQA